MLNKPLEHWIALVAGMLFVAMQHKEKPWLSRVVISAISGGVGYALATDVAALIGRSEVLAVMLTTAFGYIALDTIAAIIADREAVKSAIKSRLGAGK